MGEAEIPSPFCDICLAPLAAAPGEAQQDPDSALDGLNNLATQAAGSNPLVPEPDGDCALWSALQREDQIAWFENTNR